MFLAPELDKNVMGTKSDIWSFGIIIYLLVTGGVHDRSHEERFDFKEDIWASISEELIEFIEKAVTVKPRKRSTINELMMTEFI